MKKIAGETIVHKNEFKAVLKTEFGGEYVAVPASQNPVGQTQHKKINVRGTITTGVGTTHSSTPFMMAIETKGEDDKPLYVDIALSAEEIEELGHNLAALMQAFHATSGIDERATELRKQAMAPHPPIPPHPSDEGHRLQMVDRGPRKQ